MGDTLYREPPVPSSSQTDYLRNPSLSVTVDDFETDTNITENDEEMYESPVSTTSHSYPLVSNKRSSGIEGGGGGLSSSRGRGDSRDEKGDSDRFKQAISALAERRRGMQRS